MPDQSSRRSRDLADSLKHAWAGLVYTLRTQRNARIHLAATLGVLGLGVWLGLAASRWAVLALTVSLVWLAELFNTALEAVVDLASPQIHPLARLAKDAAAAAVLVSALASVIVGLLVLGPPLWNRLGLNLF